MMHGASTTEVPRLSSRRARACTHCMRRSALSRRCRCDRWARGRRRDLSADCMVRRPGGWPSSGRRGLCRRAVRGPRRRRLQWHLAPHQATPHALRVAPPAVSLGSHARRVGGGARVSECARRSALVSCSRALQARGRSSFRLLARWPSLGVRTETEHRTAIRSGRKPTRDAGAEPGAHRPTARCQRPSVSPQLRPSVLPSGGHVVSPLVAIGSPQRAVVAELRP